MCRTVGVDNIIQGKRYKQTFYFYRVKYKTDYVFNIGRQCTLVYTKSNRTSFINITEVRAATLTSVFLTHYTNSSIQHIQCKDKGMHRGGGGLLCKWKMRIDAVQQLEGRLLDLKWGVGQHINPQKDNTVLWIKR